MNFLIPVQALDSTIIKPTVEQVSRDVLARIGMLSHMDGKIIYRSASSELQHHRNNLGRQSVSQDATIINFSPIVNPRSIKFPKETTNTNTSIAMRSLERKYTRKDWLCPELDTYLTTNMVGMSVSMEFELIFKEYDEAIRCSRMISTRYPLSMYDTHDVEYNVPVPLAITGFWNYLYQKASPYLPVAETPMEFITNRSTRLFTVLRRSDDNEAPGIFCFGYSLKQVHGFIDFSQEAPEAQKVENFPDTFSVKFTYTFQIDTPEYHRFVFPAVIANEFVDPVYRQDYDAPLPLTIKLTDPMGYAGQSIRYFHRKNTPVVTRLPDFDKAQIDYSYSVRRGYAPFFIASVLIDDLETGTATIDLSELGPYTLRPEILTIITEHGNDIFKARGLFSISVVSNGLDIDLSQISISGTVITITGLGPLDRTHLVICDATSFRLVDRKWIPYLIKYRYTFSTFLARNLNDLVSTGAVRIQASPPIVSLFGRPSTYEATRDIIMELVLEHYTTPEVLSLELPSLIADYVCNKPSLKGGTLIDVFLEKCIAKGIIKDAGDIEFSVVHKNRLYLTSEWDLEVFDGFVPDRRPIYFIGLTVTA